jgi:hypothetical protein
MHTRSYDDWFRHSGDNKVTASAVSAVAVLALLMGGIYEEWC